MQAIRETPVTNRTKQTPNKEFAKGPIDMKTAGMKISLIWNASLSRPQLMMTRGRRGHWLCLGHFGPRTYPTLPWSVLPSLRNHAHSPPPFPSSLLCLPTLETTFLRRTWPRNFNSSRCSRNCQSTFLSLFPVPAFRCPRGIYL
jgi:hypothetical protein